MKGRAPAQPAVDATDPGGCRENDMLVAPGILNGLAEVFSGKEDGPGNGPGDGSGEAVQGELAGGQRIGSAFPVDVCGSQGAGGESFDVEKLLAVQAAAALFVAGLDGGDLNRSLNAGVGLIRFPQAERAGEAVEAALYRGKSSWASP